MKRTYTLLAAATAATLALGLGEGRRAGAMCPPCGRDPDAIRIVDSQRVYVFHRAGLEDLILESSYQGAAKDFGMILPVPSMPDVRMVQHGFFDAVARVAGNFDDFRNKSAGAPAAIANSDESWREHVQVVRRQVAGVFNAVTLKATRLDALENWLRENSYRYVDDVYARKVFQQYIDQKWLFLAVQVRVEAQNEAFNGRFRPMGVRFRSQDIVIPTRVASIYPSGMPFEIYVLTSRVVDFPTAWGGQRKLSVPLAVESLLREGDLMRELEGEAFFSATDDLSAMAARMKSERAQEYETLLQWKLTGLYLNVFTGLFSREQLATADLVFRGQDALTAGEVERRIADFRSEDLTKVREAKLALLMAGSGHIPTLVKHLADPDAQLRIAIARVLGGLGEPSAVTGLIEALDREKEPLTRAALQIALRDITGVASADFGTQAWRDWSARWAGGGK